jgi:23S rRNA (adenine2503-C2)-methyltransferase
MDNNILEEKLKNSGEQKFRLKQILKSVYQDGVLDFEKMTVLPQNLRGYLKKEINIFPYRNEKILISGDKKTIKALLKTADNNFIETVLLAPKFGAWSACVSSQIGCPLNCAFCATGSGGFKRNLTREEIEGQIIFWKNYLKENRNQERLTNIVFMGMGEPFLNFENVLESLKNLINPELFGFGSRSISVSTAGVMDKWEEFSNALPQINLALSLHFADDKKRSEFMPINKKYNLDSIRESLKKYFEIYKRKIFIEYIMFQGINDNLEDARKLSEYLKSIGHSHLLHVNLISYNMEHKTHNRNLLSPSSKEKIIAFRNCLLENRINATIRKSLGNDIQGACGQLAAH